jgi:hypothetical protein
MPEMTTAKEPSKKAKVLHVAANLAVATVCGLTFGFTTLGFFISMLSGSVVGARDFVVYWATGQQLAHHANPYDRDALLRIERAAGLPDRYGPMYMRNPPPTLLLAYPLGFLGLRIASIAWSVALLLCLVVSVYLLWQMHGKPGGHRHWLGYTFAPALVCLLNGQTSLFALLGLVIFLRLHRTHPFMAGLSMWLCTMKPHLFVPFGLVLLVWIVVSKNYSFLAGSALAIAASFAIAYRIDPMAWSQYSQMVRTSGIEWEFIPCLSVLLRVWFSQRSIWLQYVPAVVASIWALWYYWSRRAKWNWTTHGSLLMLVSIVAAPYSWLFDQALAIPALLQGAYFTRYRNLVISLAILSALVEVAMLCNTFKPSAVYLWTMWAAPAWLIWYLLAIDSANWKNGWPKWLNWLRRSHSEGEVSVESSVPEQGQAASSAE